MTNYNYNNRPVYTVSSELLLDPLEYKGAINCLNNPNYPSGSKADVYIVSVGGKIGGENGADVEAGYYCVCNANTEGGNHADVGSNWDIVERNIVDLATIVTGGVVGKSVSFVVNRYGYRLHPWCPNDITNVTNSNPCQITQTEHGYVTGDEVLIVGLVGSVDGDMEALNCHIFPVAKIDNDNFTIPFDTTEYDVFESGGMSCKVYREGALIAQYI